MVSVHVSHTSPPHASTYHATITYDYAIVCKILAYARTTAHKQNSKHCLHIFHTSPNFTPSIKFFAAASEPHLISGNTDSPNFRMMMMMINLTRGVGSWLFECFCRALRFTTGSTFLEGFLAPDAGIVSVSARQLRFNFRGGYRVFSRPKALSLLRSAHKRDYVSRENTTAT
jgi:hypothetical protein